MTYLHPGTVTGPDTTDSNYAVIQLDDGDSRDIHIDQVRYLPDNYPFVGKSKPYMHVPAVLTDHSSFPIRS